MKFDLKARKAVVAEMQKQKLDIGSILKIGSDAQKDLITKHGWTEKTFLALRATKGRTSRLTLKSCSKGGVAVFDLEKYAQCLRLQTVRTAGQETIYICPFCTTDRKAYPKLYINPKKGVFFCHHCHLEGSITDLWAMRCGVDTKTAYKQMCDLVPYTKLDRRPEEPVIVRDTEKASCGVYGFFTTLNS